MEAVTITFKATGQQLVRTGSEKFAANTVNYIRAVFDLGDGWDGFDSVRAVWATDFAKIATVLDSDGACAVPWEVLKRVDTVMVNLVGSIADGDVLTDRLTTYKVKALDVNGCTNIAGTETAEITPSQFEQFVEAVKEEVGKVKDISDVRLNDDYTLTFIFSDETGWTTPIPIRGEQGETGNGIDRVELNPDYTLTIYFSDETGWTTPIPIRGAQGKTGNGIDHIEKTATVGSVDTYTIYFTDGTTTTFDVTNGEVTKAELETLLPTESASGSIVSFPDGQSVFPMKSLKVNLEPIQDLHGYDSPWVGGAGANKYDNSIAVDNSRFSTTGTVAVNGLSRSDYIEITPNSSYYFMGVTPNNSGYSGIFWYDENKAFVRADGVNGATASTPVNLAVTAPSTAKYVGINMFTTNKDNGAVNYPSTVTAWTPYSNICPIYGHDRVGAVVSPTQDAEDGTTYTVSWQTEAGTVYGGTVDLVSGVLTVDRVMADMGTLNWTYESNYNRMSADMRENIHAPSANETNAICSAYNVVSSNYGWSHRNDETTLAVDPTGYIRVYNTGYTSASDFKTAMNGVQLCYELATPITYQLTPQQIQTLLGRNNVWSEQGGVDVTYKADIQLYIDKKTNELAVAIAAL